MAVGNPVIATAALGLVPTIQGVRGNIASQLAGSSVMRGADQAGKSVGSRMGATITSSLKTGLKIGGVITAAVAGLTLKGGINRALGIEDARAKMSGLGHDTKTVEKIMGNALASVEGTSFGLDAAATTAAGAVAAGIKPGEQLEQTLSTVANTAAAAGTGMDEIGGIFNTVAAVGAAYTGDINMIAQRGIPIWQSLGDQLGKSQEEVKKMATEGAIDFETFEAAAADAAGGVAVSMGDTTRGSIANMLTSFSKLGADVVTRFLPLVKAGAQGIQATVGAITKKLGPILDQLFGSFTPAATAGVEGFFAGLVSWIEAFDPQPMIDFFGRVGTLGKTVFAELKGGITAFGAAWSYNDGEVTSSGFPGFMERTAYFAHQLWDSIKELDFSSFSGFMDSLGGFSLGGLGDSFSGVGGSLAQIASASPTLLASGLEFLGSAMEFLADHADTVVKLLPYIVAGFVAYKVATQGLTAAVTAQRAADIATLPVQIARNATSLASAVARNRATMSEIRLTAATNVNTATTTRATIAERARTLATNIGAAASKAAALATRLLGAAIRFATGPIGLIITGVTLLAAGLVYFFTKTETGQKLWSKIWGWIKDSAAAVVDWFTGTALPYLQAAWDGIAAGALWLYENAILPAWAGIKTAIQAVGDWITGTLWPAMQTAWTAIGAAAMWLYTNVIQPVWTGIKIAIAVAVAVILTYIDLLKWYFSNVIAPVALWLWHNVISPVWAGIQAAIGAVVNWMVNTAWPLIKAAWDAIAAGAMWLWQNVLVPVWAGIQVAIAAVVNWLTGTAWPFIKSVWDAISTSVTWLWHNVITPVWAGIQAAISAVVSWLQTTAWPLIQIVIGWLQMSFEGWKLIAQTVWDAVQAAIRAVVDWFQNTAWPLLSSVIESIKTGFTTLRDSLQAAWSFIKDNIIAPVVNWFRDTVKPIFDTVTDGIGDAFTLLKDTISTAWTAIQDAAKAPIKFVVETVLNDALIANFNKVASKIGVTELPDVALPAGFARGGVLPGMSSYRNGDDQLVPMRRGEGVIVSEALRDPASRSLIHGINRAALSGGSSLASLMGGAGFAGGGILGDAWRGAKNLAGDALDKVLDGVDFVAEALKDPSSIFTKVYDAVVGNMPGVGAVMGLAKGAGKDVLDGVIAKVMGSLGVGGDVDQPGVAVSGEGWARAANAASALGLTMTSASRPGARTAGSGLVSLHALGRARDYAGSGSAMRAFFNSMDAAPYPTELLYSPMGGRNIHRSGARYANTGATRSNHFNHVHVGFAGGGVLEKPFLYDQGGEIPPGVRMIANRTSRPEKVLPPGESVALSQIADALKGRGGPAEMSLSADDRELLRAIAAAVDLKVDGKSVVRTVRDSFRGARTPLVTT